MEVKLKDEELENPYLALDAVFANFKLVEIRIALQEIEEKHLKKSFILPIKNSRPYDNILHFFEQLDKLVQASYLLYDNHTSKKEKVSS
jgi:hypothetical protein